MAFAHPPARTHAALHALFPTACPSVLEPGPHCVRRSPPPVPVCLRGVPRRQVVVAWFFGAGDPRSTPAPVLVGPFTGHRYYSCSHVRASVDGSPIAVVLAPDVAAAGAVACVQWQRCGGVWGQGGGSETRPRVARSRTRSRFHDLPLALVVLPARHCTTCLRGGWGATRLPLRAHMHFRSATMRPLLDPSLPWTACGRRYPSRQPRRQEQEVHRGGRGWAVAGPQGRALPAAAVHWHALHRLRLGA